MNICPIESILVHLNLNLTTPVGLLVPTTLTTPAGGNRLLAGNDDPPSSTHIPITTPTHIPKKEKGRHPMTKLRAVKRRLLRLHLHVICAMFWDTLLISALPSQNCNIDFVHPLSSPHQLGAL